MFGLPRDPFTLSFQSISFHASFAYPTRATCASRKIILHVIINICNTVAYVCIKW